MDNPTNNNRDKIPMPSNWSDQENFWNGTAYKKIRPTSFSKPTMPPHQHQEKSQIGMRIFNPKSIELKLGPKYPLEGPLHQADLREKGKKLHPRMTKTKQTKGLQMIRKISQRPIKKDQETSLESAESPAECTIISTRTITQEALMPWSRATLENFRCSLWKWKKGVRKLYKC